MYQQPSQNWCRTSLLMLIIHLWRNQRRTGFHLSACNFKSSGGSKLWKRIVSVSRKSIICFTWTKTNRTTVYLIWPNSPTWVCLVVVDYLDKCSPDHSHASKKENIIFSAFLPAVYAQYTFLPSRWSNVILTTCESNITSFWDLHSLATAWAMNSFWIWRIDKHW